MGSGAFAKAPSLALLLEYVCNKYFEGQTAQIKEYNIAVEALGRPPSFDPKHDSIVRVEALRLRKRLKQYYENEGIGHALRIYIAPGQYVPQFLGRETANGNGTDGTDEAVPTALAQPLEQALAIAPVEPALTPAIVAPRRRAYWMRLAVFLGLPLIAVFAVVTWFSRAPAEPKATGGGPVTAKPAMAESEDVRIICGAASIRHADRTGEIWSGDRFFHGGSVFETPNHRVVGSIDPELFRSRREGDFSYDVPLRPGPYEVHLYFAEMLYGENNTAGGGESSRVFRISINDKQTLPAFDVIADAGGSNTADERVFKDVRPAADGMLHLRFATLSNGVPFLNALEILPAEPGRMRPVRIVTRARNYTDRLGRIWGADRYFSRGSQVTRSEPVTNTADPDFFASERFGNFVYTIPVAEGRYAVTLWFSETWFGPGQPGGGGAGSRLFDVYSNGIALLRNFDQFRAAGGAQRAIGRTFHGIVPNAQGKIVLSFVPVVNYACVNAIEVVDES